MKHLYRRSKSEKQRAFTLIELLVVIAIIAILAAILFPVFAQAKAAAKTAVSISNMKQQALGLQLYIGDYDDVAFQPYGYGEYPVQLLYPYTKNVNLTWDAASPIPNVAEPMVPLNPVSGPGGPMYWGGWTLLGTLSWSQNGLMSQFGPKNYDIQQHISSEAVAVAFSNPDGEYFNGPASTYPSGDVGWFTFDPTNLSCYADYTGAGWVNTAQQGITRAANLWHAGGYVTAFMDGHAKSVKGETFDDTTASNGCGNQTYVYWLDDALNAPAYGQDPYMDVPVNPWSTWFLQPAHLQYWGTWWDRDQ